MDLTINICVSGKACVAFARGMEETAIADEVDSVVTDVIEETGIANSICQSTMARQRKLQQCVGDH
jgi:hypothetical protein